MLLLHRVGARQAILHDLLGLCARLGAPRGHAQFFDVVHGFLHGRVALLERMSLCHKYMHFFWKEVGSLVLRELRRHGRSV